MFYEALIFTFLLAFALALYWHSVREGNHLRYFIVYLLLLDDVRKTQKSSFEQWLQASNAKTADALSISAFRAIDALANRLATGDPAQPATSSVLGATAVLWNRKLGRA
jgi:hypothetical protein